ncbi:proton-coupled amino acid transporter-like protein pathetic [Leptinotarsa decemlineata]|uniref:proton-coupled amino acid transporter-like protein pathetic n=1 Tax=Leptinotarsa decemlineata TaxID=7539 RepID=UPI000C251851|nr:proton-coupled amino acid transporter-like protein pathetic [Leptinotarsa decemlineata]
MTKKKHESVFTLDSYTSTTTLATNDQIKIPIGSSIEKIYSPYDNRKLEHPNTYVGAFVHLVKSSLGSGILSMPRAFHSAGLLVGLFGTILVGLLCTHTVNLLVSASQRMCILTKTPSLGYAGTAEAVFKNGPKIFQRWSTFAKNFADIALALTYNVGCSVYIVFISESVVKLVSFYYEPAADPAWSQYFKLMMLLPLILLCQVRELKHLVPFSFIANITMVVAFGITLYYMCVQIKDVKVEDRELVTGFNGLPVFFSTVIFSMEGIGTIMPVENSMVTPNFIGCSGVLNMGMTVIVTLFSAMGFFGYYAYGAETKDTITQNLPSEEIMAQVVQAAISISVFFTFMLQYYVPTEITWRKIRPKIPEKHHNIAEIITRTLLVCFIVSIAAAAGRNLGPLIDMAGAIFLATLGFLIPAVLDIVINWGNWGKFNYILVKDLLLCIFSLLGTAAGTHSAIKGFMNS